jgi:Na+/proline symporter
MKPLDSIPVLSYIIVFAAVMLGITLIRRASRSLNHFLVSNRSMGTWMGGMSAASTWIWAPALFIASQKAFTQGLPGLMWFTVPNIGALVLFAYLGSRIRSVFPRGYTFPQYIAVRFDKRTHITYLSTFLSLQVCSLAVQLIAGGALIQELSGIPYWVCVVLLIVIFTSYSLLDGIRASIRTDFFQMMIILLGIAIIIPFAVTKGGGITAVTKGFAGFEGKHGNIFDPYIALSFGITVTIGLLSGPVGDQQHWQRAFSFKQGKVFKGYLLAALIFAIVPLAMSIPGFIAAGNPSAAPAVYSGQLPAQQVGTEVIRILLPEWALILFVVMILSGLSSTGDSALCAGGSLIAVDIYRKYVYPGASEKKVLAIVRLSIFGLAATAVGIALIPGITILGLFLFYGTLRSATFLPTILIIYKKKIPAAGVFWGIFFAVALGLPVYIWGVLKGILHLKIAANIGILAISLIFPWAAIMLKKRQAPPIQLDRDVKDHEIEVSP